MLHCACVLVSVRRGVLLFEQGEPMVKVRCSPTVGVAIAAALAYSFVASTDYVCTGLKLLKTTG